MNFRDDYRAKLLTHQELVGQWKPGNYIVFGSWMAQPHGIMRALSEFGRDIDPLYVFTSPASAAGEFLTQPNIHVVSGFLGAYERAARRERKNVSYHPTQYTDAYKSVRTNPPADYIALRVAPMDDRGDFNLSLSSSWEHDAINWLSHNAPNTRVIVEVNRHLPRVCGLPQFGDHNLHISDVDFIVEDHTPLPQYSTAEPSETDRTIAAHVAGLVEDRATIQLGIGTIPMCIGKLLTKRKELGIHTELFCQSHVDLIEAGSVTNSHKGLYDGISVATFALGEDRLYRWLNDNRDVAMVPVHEINSVPVLSRVQRMTSINSILNIDLSGQACAHCIGPQTYSGLGGAFEFAYGSQLSPGGKSLLCVHSTTTLRDGLEVSNILDRHPAGTRITIPEHCVDWVVTEYGAVRLKFLSLEWRAAALISIAHPKYRDQLTEQARANGLDIPSFSGHRVPPAHFFSRSG